MSQFYSFPPIVVTATNPSVGNNGATAPIFSTEIGGINQSNGFLQPLQTDAAGNLLVNINASSLSPIAVQDASDGPVTPGAVASKSSLIGGQFNTVLPTLANTQQAAIQVDSSARLILSPLTNSSVVKAQLQDNAGTPVVLGQALMAASLPVAIASDQSTLPISAASLPLPTGASTSALQVTGNTTLSTISGQLPSPLGAHVIAASLAVNVASDQVVPISASALPLPAGAATSALQTQISGQLPATLGAHVTAASLAVNIASDQTVPVSAASLPLPAGAATAANQTNLITNTTGLNLTIAAKGAASPADALQIGIVTAGNLNPITTGSATSANSIPVVIASDQGSIPTKAAGKVSLVPPVRNVYASTNVTTAAYVQLIASTGAAVSEIEIFDSSGQTLALAFGAAASEVQQINIFPGGNGRIPLAIPAATRVSVIALSATANVGELDINLYE